MNLKKKNLNKLKEKLLYYYASPEILLNFKKNEEEKYDFYKNLDCENFLSSQDELFKIILSGLKSDGDVEVKKNKQNKLYIDLCRFIPSNNNNNVIINANIIGRKLDELNYYFIKKEIDENKILIILNEIKDIFLKNIIDMESIGIVFFNYIERNLIHILQIIENKLSEKNEIKILSSFILICIDLLKNFHSTKLYFFVLKFLKFHNDVLNSTKSALNKEIIQFIPNNILNFQNLRGINYSNLNENLILSLVNKGFIKRSAIGLRESLKLDDYRTLFYDNYLLLFIQINEIEIKDILFIYKIDIIEKKIVDIIELELLNKVEEDKNKLNILDINLSIKNDLICIIYIVNNSSNYYLNCKLLHRYTLTTLNEEKIQIKNSFIPISLFNDNKYLYCMSNSNEILMIKTKLKEIVYKYINCSYKLYNKDLTYNKEIKGLISYKMYNSLNINNLMIIENFIEHKKYVGKFINKENNDYILNLYEMVYNTDNNIYNDDKYLKVSYNEKRFAITKLLNGRLSYRLSLKNNNNFLNKGISLLPFDSNISILKYSNNLYEYLLQEYAFFLNLCGNFDLVNNINLKNLINFPFSPCCNFDKINLFFIIDNMIENLNNKNNENLTLYYLIILKQIICSLYNADNLETEKFGDLISYLKKIILININSKEKKHFNKILRQIIDIFSYIQNNTIIEINEIKDILDNNNIKYKSKILLIELLLKQNKTKKQKELYQYIIQIEKNYLIDIFTTNNSKEKYNSFYINNYYLLHKIMIEASEILYSQKENIEDELKSLLSTLSTNIELIIESYQKALESNNNIFGNFSFLYNSFIFRCFHFIIECLFANKIFLNDKQSIIMIYKILLMLDKINLNYNDCFDKDNIIEVNNY